VDSEQKSGEKVKVWNSAVFAKKCQKMAQNVCFLPFFGGFLCP
jgi:hypothetical protein